LDASIIDVGGGASTLVDDLLSEAFQHVSVLDLSASALAVARKRLGATGDSVTWIAGDIREVALPERTYDICHDRAVFWASIFNHFAAIQKREAQAQTDQGWRCLSPASLTRPRPHRRSHTRRSRIDAKQRLGHTHRLGRTLALHGHFPAQL
jgi:hypothetical protein